MSDVVLDAAPEALEPTPEVLEVAAPPAVPEVDLSTQFADLKRRERDLRAERNKMKSSMDEAKKSWADELRKDPIKALREYGISADTVANALMGGELEAAPQPAVVPAEIQEKLDRLEQERQDRILTDFRKDVFAVVEKDAESFELLLNSKNGRDLYWGAVVDYYQTYGEAPDYASLAQDVETALLDEGKRLLALKKFAPVAPPPAVKSEGKPKDSGDAFTTLSNKLTADAFSRSKPRTSPGSTDTRPVQTDFAVYQAESKRAVLKKFAQG